MQDPRPDEAGKRRGRRAAAPTGPVRPLDAVAGVVAAWLTAARAGLLTARRRGVEALTAFRAGPVIPWVSAHRMLVLVGGALLVSALAIGGAVAMIAQVPRPVAGGDAPVRPQPGSDFTMPSPVPTSPTPAPTTAPAPTPTDAPAPVPSGEPSPEPDEPIVDPEPTTEPDEPDEPDGTDGPPTGSNGRPDPPGATNRPDKPKG